MTITTKFDEGDYVWFKADTKFYQAKIIKITAWEIPSDKDMRGFLYKIKHINVDNSSEIETYKYEYELYKDKNEAVNDMFIEFQQQQ